MSEISVTFAVDETLVRAVEELAARNHTDLPAMFKRYLVALASTQEPIDESKLPPITRSSLGLWGELPGKPYRDTIADSLGSKYDSLDLPE